ncbi:MAG: hypothetical protein IIA88_07485 [Bacteroidetes bacterium]|nr:hypothetical protein [Bacteroidota bacterium]
MKIKGIAFDDSDKMIIYLDNDLTVMVPLNKFKDIEQLTLEERKDFEIIDDCYLSFLAIDKVYSISDLTGIV